MLGLVVLSGVGSLLAALFAVISYGLGAALLGNVKGKPEDADYPELDEWFDAQHKFATKEEASEAFDRVITECRAAHKRGAELHERTKELGEQLVKVQRTMTEDRGQRVVVGSDEREMDRRYLDTRNGGKVRWMTGPKSFEFGGHLHTVPDAPGLLDDRNPTCQWQRDLQRIASRRAWARFAFTNETPVTPNLDADLLHHLSRAPTKDLREAAERAFTDSTGVGGDWIRDGWIPDLYQAYETPRIFAGAFQEVPVSATTFQRPKITTGARPYLKGKITSDNPASYTPTTPATDVGSSTVPGFAIRILVDEVASEDSAVAAIPTLQRLMMAGLDDGFEDCGLNGDTAATHQDTIAAWNIRSRWGSSGLGGSADHRRGFIGGRARAFDIGSTAKQDGSAVQTAAGFLAALAKMGERAQGRVVAFMSPEYVVQKVMAWDQVMTVQNFGLQASILQGAPMAVFNVPIRLSRFVSADLNASGLYDDTTKTKSWFQLFDLDSFFIYRRRGPVMETQKVIMSGHFECVATLMKLLDTPDASTVVNTVTSYNLL